MRSEVNNSDFLVVLFQFFVSTLISISRNGNLKQIVNYIKPSSFNFMITISYVFYCNNCYEMFQILKYVFIYLPPHADSWRRKWQPTPVFLPGESHGQRRLADYSPWGHKELDTTEQITHTDTDWGLSRGLKQ